MAKVNKNGNCIYFFDLLSHQDGRTYVGSTKNIKKRFREYTNYNDKRFCTNTIKKYGFENFYKLIIQLGDVSYKEMLLWEQFYIGLFGTYHKENKHGMNLVRNPTEAISKDPLVAKKISLSRTGQKMAESTKLKISNLFKGKINVGVKRPYLSERNKTIKPALGRVGDKHPMSKKVLYIPENKIFHSFQDCADYICVSRPTIANRINSNHKDYKLI